MYFCVMLITLYSRNIQSLLHQLYSFPRYRQIILLLKESAYFITPWVLKKNFKIFGSAHGSYDSRSKGQSLSVHRPSQQCEYWSLARSPFFRGMTARWPLSNEKQREIRECFVFKLCLFCATLAVASCLRRYFFQFVYIKSFSTHS